MILAITHFLCLGRQLAHSIEGYTWHIFSAEASKGLKGSGLDTEGTRSCGPLLVISILNILGTCQMGDRFSTVSCWGGRRRRVDPHITGVSLFSQAINDRRHISIREQSRQSRVQSRVEFRVDRVQRYRVSYSTEYLTVVIRAVTSRKRKWVSSGDKPMAWAGWCLRSVVVLLPGKSARRQRKKLKPAKNRTNFSPFVFPARPPPPRPMRDHSITASTEYTLHTEHTRLLTLSFISARSHLP